MFQYAEYIYEIYRTGSFSKAARNLYVTQPALSIAVRKTEAALGTALFDRSVSPVRLTKMGEVYIEGVKEIRAVEERTKQRSRELSGELGGRLRLGASSFLLSEAVLPALGEFAREYPAVRVEVEEAPSPKLKAGLLDDRLDLIVDPVRLSGEEPFHLFLLFTDTFLLAVPQIFEVNRKLSHFALSREEVRQGSHLEEGCPAVPLEEFRREPFILLRSGSNACECAMAACGESGFIPEVRFYLDQLLTAYRFTEWGLGVSFLSDSLIQRTPGPAGTGEGNGVCFYKLASSAAKRRVYAAQKKGRPLTEAERAFIEITEKKIKSWKK